MADAPAVSASPPPSRYAVSSAAASHCATWYRHQRSFFLCQNRSTPHRLRYTQSLGSCDDTHISALIEAKVSPVRMAV